MDERIIAWIQRIPGGGIIENPWVQSGVILGFFLLLAFVVLFIFKKYCSMIAGKTKTKFDDIVFDKTRWPLFYFVVLYGLSVAVGNLNLLIWLEHLVDSIAAALFIVVLSRTVEAIIITWGENLAKKTDSSIDDVLLPLFLKSVKVVFFIIGVMWVLDVWQIDITPYLAGVGISGIVLGLALQDSLKNVFGGVSMILDKNFSLGDPVRLESGELGTIEEIGLRSTKILTYDSELIFVPNGQLANMKLRNYLKPNDRVRKIVDFSVGYGTDVARVKKMVLGILKGIKKIHSDPYMDVVFVSMGESGLLFKARFFVDWADAYSTWLETTEKIHAALVKAKVDIPYPTRTVLMKKVK